MAAAAAANVDLIAGAGDDENAPLLGERFGGATGWGRQFGRIPGSRPGESMKARKTYRKARFHEKVSLEGYPTEELHQVSFLFYYVQLVESCMYCSVGVEDWPECSFIAALILYQ